MATALTDLVIKESYHGLIKTCDNAVIPSGGILLTDGFGNSSSVTIYQPNGGLGVTGDINATNGAVIGTSLSTGSGFNVNSSNLTTTGLNVTITGGTTTLAGTTTTIANALTVNSSITNTGNIVTSGSITATGPIRSCNDIVAFYTSDGRLKNNIQPIESQKIIEGINGYIYTWNEKSEYVDQIGAGVVAQELQKVFPQAVHERDNGYLAVDYIKIIPVLIEEVKRLNNEIITLKEQI
jgi:hypothetical protein